MNFRYTAQEKVIVWLDSFEELTYSQKCALTGAFSPVELVNRFGTLRTEVLRYIPAEMYDKMFSALQDGEYLPKLLRSLEKKGIFFVTYLSERYPQSLKNIPAFPLILYCKGRGELLKRECFSIIGSRKILPWAKKLTEQTTATMSEFFTIVTGTAEGGDTAVLRGALQRKEANVIGVVAYGFDYISQTAQAEILGETAKKGLLVSEYRPQVKPQKFLFPARNRIIAGLSRGVLVVGAGKRSGTNITAHYAMEYGRDVFAFPYTPGIAEGEGCNALLKEGALLAEGAEDVLSAYGLAEEREEREAEAELNEEEREVMEFLRTEGEMHVEKLAEALKKPAYLLGGTLSVLEVKGLVVRSGGNRYGVIGK